MISTSSPLSPTMLLGLERGSLTSEHGGPQGLDKKALENRCIASKVTATILLDSPSLSEPLCSFPDAFGKAIEVVQRFSIWTGFRRVSSG
jgi:hypothetical protein